NFVDGLVAARQDLLELAGAASAAVLSGGRCALVGETPSEDEARRLADWLTERGAIEVFSTDSLSGLRPEAAGYAERASGLLAVGLSKLHPGWLLWFRPEQVQTVRWAGDPRNPAELPAGDRPHPRRSFELWKQEVRRRSLPWKPAELEAAGSLRNALLGS